jgi:hypothetical protein
MIWFLQRNTDLMVCEIRQTIGEAAYEFEIAPPQGPPQTLRFESPTALINEYLRNQSVLQAEGWRPRLGDLGL